MINTLSTSFGSAAACFNTIFTHLRHPFRIEINGQKKAIYASKKNERNVILISFLAGLALAGIGGLCVFYIWTAKRKWEVWNTHKKDSSSSAGKTHQAGTASLNANPFLKKWNDSEILASLKKTYSCNDVCKQAGRDGNSLFLSLVDQIKDEDIHAALNMNTLDDEIKHRLNDWDPSKSEIEKALILRNTALMIEERFIRYLEHADLNALPEEDIQWLGELYRDMLQEFNHSYSSIRDKAAKADAQTIFAYFKEVVPSLGVPRFNAYLERTNQNGHAAGTSEMTALSYLLKRPILAYGNDHASSVYVKVDEHQKALPFIVIQPNLISSKPPIALFQCNGGGHYKVLKTV